MPAAPLAPEVAQPSDPTAGSPPGAAGVQRTGPQAGSHAATARTHHSSQQTAAQALHQKTGAPGEQWRVSCMSLI